MRILYLSQLIPYPANAGPKVRIYHILEYLAQAGHEITLVAFIRPEDDPESIEHLRRFCQEIYTAPITRSRLRDLGYLAKSIIRQSPFLISRDHEPKMNNLICDLLASHDFDAIHADQLWMAQYALYANSLVTNNPQMVLDQHNAVYLIPHRLAKATNNPWLKIGLHREERQLLQYELTACESFDKVVWVTEEDRLALYNSPSHHHAPSPGEPVSSTEHYVIPICVDSLKKARLPHNPTGKRVTFLGGLHWPPNAQGVNWLVNQIWPHVVAAVPDALLTIIGKNPPEEIPSRPDIEVTGYVEDTTPYLIDTAAFVVPLLAGGGMRVKIIDAWAWGLPVVSTTIGAEGIQVINGENILLAESPEDFSTAIIELLTSPETGKRLGSNGRSVVETRYDWRVQYPAWDAIYPA